MIIYASICLYLYEHYVVYIIFISVRTNTYLGILCMCICVEYLFSSQAFALVPHGNLIAIGIRSQINKQTNK